MKEDGLCQDWLCVVFVQSQHVFEGGDSESVPEQSKLVCLGGMPKTSLTLRERILWSVIENRSQLDLIWVPLSDRNITTMAERKLPKIPTNQSLEDCVPWFLAHWLSKTHNKSKFCCSSSASFMGGMDQKIFTYYFTLTLTDQSLTTAVLRPGTLKDWLKPSLTKSNLGLEPGIIELRERERDPMSLNTPLYYLGHCLSISHTILVQ